MFIFDTEPFYRPVTTDPSYECRDKMFTFLAENPGESYSAGSSLITECKF
jgi:hypothetical protein